MGDGALDLRSQFDRDGFVNAGPVLEPSEVVALAEEMERFIDDGFRERPTGVPQPIYRIDLGGGADHLYQIANLWEVSEPFRKLVGSRRLVEAAVACTGTPYLQVWIDQVMYKPERHGAHFGWHQDGGYHRLSVEPAEQLLGAWIALDDADEDTGCMWMAPGSHRWGLRERELLAHRHLAEARDFVSLPGTDIAPDHASEWLGVVPCPVKAGEVHFHHPHTWHGSPTNRSGRKRRGYAVHYMRDGVRCVTDRDERLPLRPGTPMAEAGPRFPIVYPFPA